MSCLPGNDKQFDLSLRIAQSNVSVDHSANASAIRGLASGFDRQ
jgi:hypothetical protein